MYLDAFNFLISLEIIKKKRMHLRNESTLCHLWQGLLWVRQKVSFNWTNFTVFLATGKWRIQRELRQLNTVATIQLLKMSANIKEDTLKNVRN